MVAHCYAVLRSSQQPASSGGDIATATNSSSDSSSSGRSPISSGGVSNNGSSSSPAGYHDEDKLTYSSAVSLAANWQDRLPASHQQVLQRLGCSSKGVLWAADMLAKVDTNVSHLGLTAAAHSIASQWALQCTLQQAEKSTGPKLEMHAVAGVTHAAENVLLASILLHCAAHCPSHPYIAAYMKVCKFAASFATGAWRVFGSRVQECLATEAPAMHSEQQQAVVAELENLAAAEEEQVLFLTHVLAGLLGLLQQPALATAGKPVATMAESSNSSNNSSGGNTGSTSISVNSDSAGLAMSEVVSALTVISQHCCSRHDLRNNLAGAGVVKSEGDRPAAGGAAMASQSALAATLQDCVRLSRVRLWSS
jgi:hypothetical protein